MNEQPLIFLWVYNEQFTPILIPTFVPFIKPMKVESISPQHLSQLSTRDRDYLMNSDKLKEYIKYPFSYEAFSQIIEDRAHHSYDRQLLQQVIKDQYEGLAISDKTSKHIKALSTPDSYTVITAHQPSLLTGPLYYVFKILSAINLAARLNKDFPNKHIIPVFVIGGEDHDFDEINHLHLYGKRLAWEREAIGSVGNLDTDGLNEILSEVGQVLGERSQALDLVAALKKDVTASTTYGDFSFKLTHRLFDELGLVILRMHDTRLKTAFIPQMEKELTEQASHKLVKATQDEIKSKFDYNFQAHAREINLFHNDSKTGRNRIVFEEDRYSVLNTELSFSKKEILALLKSHPERFSPNVIMRPLFQDSILPNLAYIGGGGELAYWTERKSQFEHFGIPYPMLIRRQSGMILTASMDKQRSKLNLSIDELFKNENDLTKLLLSSASVPEYSLAEYKTELEQLYKKVEEHVATIDPSLVKTTGAEANKGSKSLDYLESKLKKVIKQREEVNLNRMTKLKTSLFPKGLQERHDNIFQYISDYGISIIGDLLPYCNPFDKDFKVFMPQK